MNCAILTEYYNSVNYGGVLQAYALTSYLNKNYCHTEQLPYITTKAPPTGLFKKISKYNLKTGSVQVINKIRQMVMVHVILKKELGKIKNREAAVTRFREKIPHNSIAYSDDNIAEAVNQYDIFIVGSDQVWRTINNKAYFLQFVPNNKKKGAYAASISRDYLTEDEKEFFKGALSSLDFVSVREQDTMSLLKKLTSNNVEWTVDPTFLLDKDEWNVICANRIVKEEYVFCYFLGDGIEHRKLAQRYARQHLFKLITIPYLNGRYRKCDEKFGSGSNEQKLFDIGPEDFLSLIKYANCVFTDSFHAIVFSNIFKKDYFAFDRPVEISMNTRIYSLLKLLNTETRFCNSAERLNLEYLNNLNPIDYNIPQMELSRMVDSSQKFIHQIFTGN